MSLSQAAAKAVNDVVRNYINRISLHYSLNESELLELWNESGKSSKTKSPKKTSKTTPKTSPSNSKSSELNKMVKKELVELCKAQGHKVTGTKAVLIARLTGEEEPVKSSPKTKAKPKKNDAPPVVKKLTGKIPTVPIRRNQFGNFEHPESGLVFNNRTRKVIGKQNEDGTVDELTPEDIDICNKFKFSYDLPENLDKNVDLDDVEVDELDDEEEEDEEEVEELKEEDLLGDESEPLGSDEEYEEYEEDEEEDDE